MSKYIRDGQLHIDETELARMFSKYGKDGCVTLINDLIDEYAIPLPFSAPTFEEAQADFEALLNFDRKLLTKSPDGTFVKYPSESFKTSDWYLDQSMVGNIGSNYFHHQARMYAEHARNPSPMRVWSTPRSRVSALSAIFSMKMKRVDTKALQKCIALRKYIASQFRPSSARELYNRYATNGRVLDMCSGWGDRLQGFLASDALEYVGFDPNIHLHDNYRKQIRAFGDGKKKAVIHYMPFEKSKLEANSFDIAFTSPPYYDIERYSKDVDQSWVKYKTCDEWTKKFLIQMALKALASLKVGGHLFVNISDVYSNGTVNKICDPMNMALRKAGAQEAKHLGYKMSKRLGSASDQKGIFVEPVWHWIKR